MFRKDDIGLIVYLFKQKPNNKQEYYKTQQSECYYAHGYLQYMCTILNG